MADRIVSLVPPVAPVGDSGLDILGNVLAQVRGALALLRLNGKCNTDNDDDIFHAEQLLILAIARADDLFCHVGG